MQTDDDYIDCYIGNNEYQKASGPQNSWLATQRQTRSPWAEEMAHTPGVERLDSAVRRARKNPGNA